MRFIKKILLIIICFLVVTLPCYAADYYIAQTAVGSGNGSSCANADAIADLIWSGAGDMVNAGDTLHLCSDGGDFTTALTIGDSGSSEIGSITIKFEDGAKFSKSVWTTSAIIASGKSYIVVDGGTNGIIENTDNGSAAGGYGNQLQPLSIWFHTGCNNIEIKNLTIRNLYVRTAADDYSAGAASSATISFEAAGSNISFHDNICTYASRGVSMAFVGTVTGYYFYNNTFTNGTAILWSNGQATNANLTGLYIYNNTANLGHAWTADDDTDRFHAEYLHLHTDGYTGMLIHDVKIYNNTFGPEVPMRATNSPTTAWIFDEAKGNNHWIYNNLFIADPDYDATDGLFCRSSNAAGTGTKILNNTFVKLGTQGKNAINISYFGDTDLEIKNNIVINIGHGVYCEGGTALELTSASQIDYNDYYGVSYMNSSGTMAAWLLLGYDEHSITIDPGLDVNYKPQAYSETNATWKGTATGQLSLTDKAGVSWHAPPSIGAYEYRPNNFFFGSGTPNFFLGSGTPNVTFN